MAKDNKYAYTECICGGKMYYRSTTCARCRSKAQRVIRRERTLDDILTRGPSRTKWTQVRRDANQVLEEIDREKVCAICGFDVYVECCHIKAIVDFPLETQVKDVNTPTNLIYLCPNHHKMLDKGLLQVPVV